MRLIIYARVSTEEQVAGTSLEQQTNSCRAWCSALGHTAVRTEIDAGFSAKSIKTRPSLQRALTAIRVGEADGIVSWKLDRITRSIADLLALVEDSIARGWSICSVTEQIDTSTPMGRMMLNILGIMAQWERESIVQRVTAGMKHNRSIGNFVGGRVPAGTKVISVGERRRLIPNEHSEAVKKIWSLAVAGASLAEIGKHLSENHVPAAGKQGWVPERVRSLLNSPQVVLAGLVSVADQALARAVVSSRGTARNTPKATSDGWEIEALFKCPSCGSGVTSYMSKGLYRYFKCHHRVKGRCKQKDLRVAPIAEACDGMILTILASRDFREEYANSCALAKTGISRVREELIQAQRQLDLLREGCSSRLSRADPKSPAYELMRRDLDRQLLSATHHTSDLEAHLATLDRLPDLKTISELADEAIRQACDGWPTKDGSEWDPNTKQLNSTVLVRSWAKTLIMKVTIDQHGQPVIDLVPTAKFARSVAYHALNTEVPKTNRRDHSRRFEPNRLVLPTGFEPVSPE